MRKDGMKKKYWRKGKKEKENKKGKGGENREEIQHNTKGKD